MTGLFNKLFGIKTRSKGIQGREDDEFWRTLDGAEFMVVLPHIQLVSELVVPVPALINKNEQVEP
jgi:hypothetical protein